MFHVHSGSSLMPDMTQLLMPTTPLTILIVSSIPYICTMKTVGISTISRHDHHVAQTRELECTKVVVPQVIARYIQCHVYYNALCVRV
jgi:hypothetical protein